MKKIIKSIIVYHRFFLVLSLILTVVFGFFLPKLKVDASTQTLLIEKDKDLEFFKTISTRYKSPNFLILAYTPDDELLSKKTLEHIKEISSDILKIDGVKSVFSIINAPLLENKKLLISELISKIPTVNDKDVNLNAAKQEFLTNPLYKNILVSSDFKTTALIIELSDDFANKNLQNHSKISAEEFISQKEHERLQNIRQYLSKYKDQKLFLGGVSLIADDMISYVKNDLLIYGLSTLLLVILSLWLFFRQIKFIILPVMICLGSVVITSGIFGLFGFKITVISSNYIALQLIITISVVIHLITAYREIYFLHPKYSQNMLVYLTLRSKLNPCFFAIFTTMIGFLSLCLSQIKPVIMLGVMMSISVVISLIIAFVVFGSYMAISKKVEPKRTFEKHFNLTKICAKIVIKHKKYIYLISIIAVILGLYGSAKLIVENSFIGYFKQNTEIYKGMSLIDKKLGGTIPLDVIIKFNHQGKNGYDSALSDFEDEFSSSSKYWFSIQKIQIAKKIGQFLQQQKFIGSVSSLDTLLEVAKRLNNGNDLDPLSLAFLYTNLPNQYKKILIDPYVNIENDELRFVLRIVDSDKNLRRNEFINELKHNLNLLLKNDNVTIEIGGVMVLYNNMLQSLFASQTNTFIFVVVALWIIFVAIFKSIKLATIAIVANLVPLCAIFGVMGFSSIPLDIMSITIAAISLGIGVDDIIHYIYKFKLEIKKKNKAQAIYSSHSSIGYAMYYTSFAIFLGFSVMSLSNFWPTIYFGILTDLVMLMMLCSALLLLPALIFSFTKSDDFNCRLGNS